MSYVVRGGVNFSQGQHVQGMGVEQYFKWEGIVCYKFFVTNIWAQKQLKGGFVSHLNPHVLCAHVLFDKPNMVIDHTFW